MTTKLTLLAIGTSISYISIYEPLPGNSAIASQLSYRFSAPALISTESTSIRNITRLYISISVSRSPVSSKSSVTSLVSTEKLLSLLAYRSILFLLSNYTSRSYFTIDNLYIRYAFLNYVRVTSLKYIRYSR